MAASSLQEQLLGVGLVDKRSLNKLTSETCTGIKPPKV